MRFVFLLFLLASLIPLATLAQRDTDTPSFLQGEISPAGDTQNTLSEHLLRIVDMEEQLRLQQGIIEELKFRVKQMEQRVEAQHQATSRDPQAESGSAAANTATAARNRPAPVAKSDQQSDVFVKNTPDVTDSATSRAAYEAAFELIKQEQYEKASTAFADYVAQFPNSSLTENALYWHAETYFARGQFAESAIEFLKAYQTYPIGKKAPDNLLKLSISLGKIGKITEACGTLDKLAEEFPNSPLAIKQRSNQEYIALDCS